MSELLAVILPIALVDSASITPLALVPVATLLAGKRPYLTSASFLVGLYVSYFVMAVASMFGLSAVFTRLNTWAEHRWHHPEPVDFLLELVIGLLLLVVVLRIARGRSVRKSGREMQSGATPAAAFGFACLLNLVGFPGALPWFAALDQILRFDPPAAQQALAVAAYVGVFVMPLTALVLLRAALGERGDAFMAAVQRFFDVWGRRVVIVLFLLLGLVMTVDGAIYLARGAPLIPIGWP